MRKIVFSLITLLSFMGIADPSSATTESESKEETMGYVRVILSDKRVLNTFQTLLNDGYLWVDEQAYFGSIDENGRSHAEVHIVMKKKHSHERSKVDYGKTLVAFFIWDRKKN